MHLCLSHSNFNFLIQLAILTKNQWISYNANNNCAGQRALEIIGINILKLSILFPIKIEETGQWKLFIILYISQKRSILCGSTKFCRIIEIVILFTAIYVGYFQKERGELFRIKLRDWWERISWQKNTWKMMVWFNLKGCFVA